jgi:Asp/Glu/hydantoin racemase
VLEGAPARLPRDVTGVCTASELEWLRSGRRVELATRTPKQVMELIRHALPDEQPV